jgi:nucleotide-binding universal stress UspA family protein
MQRIERILLATDLSETSNAAAELATALSQAHGAKLLVVYVSPGQPTAHMGPLYSSLPDPQIPQVARKLAAIHPQNDGCEHRILVGDPATEIISVAKQESADLIILGTHAWSGARRLLLGSVAEYVLQHAPAAVYVCKASKLAAP